MQGIFRKENTDKALKYGIYRHLPTYEKIIRNLVSFYLKYQLLSEQKTPGNLFGFWESFLFICGVYLLPFVRRLLLIAVNTAPREANAAVIHIHGFPDMSAVFGEFAVVLQLEE